MLLRIEMNESLLHDGDEVLSAESDADLLIEFGKSSVSAQDKVLLMVRKTMKYV